MLRYYPKRTGSAFTSANTETWNYNAKGEVVTANSSNNAFDRSFEFDGIGNRKKSADSITLPTADNYVANTLNQLTSANGGARIHDADGNLIDDGTKLVVWDAENRLIEIKLKSDDSTVATYAYDYQSRRITKTVGSTVTNFVYEGWNPIAEYTSALSPLSFTLSTSYTWGMDLSESMQNAGGGGGLLSVNDGSATYYPTFDGNGNVSEYVDATGVVVAHYEYDAFGQVVASGSKKDDFTHQFSTKQLDSESGLHYYGYRYYDSSNGRWPSRDPIEEQGGINLYGFVRNDGVDKWDRLGMIDMDLIPDAQRKGRDSDGCGEIKSPVGTFSVEGHGSPQSMGNKDGSPLSVVQLANLIKKHDSYKKGWDVYLYSCSVGSGADSFAQRLANIMNVNVYAPTKTCFIKKKGRYEIYDKKKCLIFFLCKDRGHLKKFTPVKPPKAIPVP